jgi:hypothetical protein
MKSSTSRRAFVAAITFAAFLWTLTLSASPQLHARVHPDANSSGHACAVTMIAAGNVDNSPPAVLAITPASIDEFTIPELKPRWIESLFLIAAVFEHAPPA